MKRRGVGEAIPSVSSLIKRLRPAAGNANGWRSLPAMPSTRTLPRRRSAAPRSYDELLHCVQHVLFTGRREIEAAWVYTYHEIGRYINVHILRHHGRSDYGAGVFVRLSADTGVSKRTLHECAQFHRHFPIV
jgi:hypothetical protein